MTQICLVLTREAAARLASDPRMIGGKMVTSEASDGTIVAAIESQHVGLRFDLASEDGVVVMPGMHDPSPIGDLYKHLTHVGAQPHHTMREVALMLYAVHGPVYHPDV